jgi:hypothetical protein
VFVVNEREEAKSKEDSRREDKSLLRSDEEDETDNEYKETSHNCEEIVKEEGEKEEKLRDERMEEAK